MASYINKLDVIAQANIEITGCRLAAQQGILTDFGKGKLEALEGIVDFLDTLEVKEVDLNREIRCYRMNNPIIGHREESLYDYMANVAKHFFELGLKAQKGE